MNDAFIREPIPVIILYLALAIFAFFAYIFLRRRKKRHAESYDLDMDGFSRAVQNEDPRSMQLFGDRIIWNEHLKQSDKKIIYQSVQPRVELHPELKQLWKDVHYKTHGHDPLASETQDEWTGKATFTSSRDDIIDR